MRTAYRVLASLVAGLVVLQAALIAWAMSGLSKWVADGGTLDAAAGLLVGRARVPGPVAAPRVAALALAGAVLVEGLDVLRALAVRAPVDLLDVGVRCLLTATVAALVVPLVVGAERAVLRRRFG